MDPVVNGFGLFMIGINFLLRGLTVSVGFVEIGPIL